MTATLVADLERHLTLFLATGAVLIGLGFLVGQFRLGRIRGATEALHLQAAELDVLRQRNVTITADLKAAEAEVHTLRGIVEQLREDNRELRSLVMGETVPPALQHALDTAFARAVEQLGSTFAAEADRRMTEVIAFFEQQFHPVAQGLDRLLTAGGREGVTA